MSDGEMRLYDAEGKRLYLNAEERAAFLSAARKQPPEVLALCEVLHWTGCRASEPLEVTAELIALNGAIVFRSLKKRRPDAFRSVPIPPSLVDGLERTFSIRQRQRSRKLRSEPLWPISRVRVWQIVTGVMKDAGILEGPHRVPKGLRHGFCIHAIASGVPVTSVQKWAGHAQLSTTAIYVDAQGAEARDLASRMW